MFDLNFQIDNEMLSIVNKDINELKSGQERIDYISNNFFENDIRRVGIYYNCMWNCSIFYGVNYLSNTLKEFEYFSNLINNNVYYKFKIEQLLQRQIDFKLEDENEYFNSINSFFKSLIGKENIINDVNFNKEEIVITSLDIFNIDIFKIIVETFIKNKYIKERSGNLYTTNEIIHRIKEIYSGMEHISKNKYIKTRGQLYCDLQNINKTNDKITPTFYKCGYSIQPGERKKRLESAMSCTQGMNHVIISECIDNVKRAESIFKKIAMFNLESNILKKSEKKEIYIATQEEIFNYFCASIKINSLLE